MNKNTFERIVEDSLDMCKAVLERKQKEYSSNEDKLHNFEAAKSFMRCKSKEYALWGMLTKHLVSVTDIVEKFEKDGVLPTSNTLDEKIGDSILYLILLKVCFYDDMIKAEAEKPCKCDCEREKEKDDKIKDYPERAMSWTEILKQNEGAIANSMYQNPRKRLVVENLRKILKPLSKYFTDNSTCAGYEQIKRILKRAEFEDDSMPDEFIKDVVIEIEKLQKLPLEMRDKMNEIIADILKPPLTKFKAGDEIVAIFCPEWSEKWSVSGDMNIVRISVGIENKEIYYHGLFFDFVKEKDCFKTKEEAQRECDNRNNTNTMK